MPDSSAAIVACAGYVPRHRLEREDVGARSAPAPARARASSPPTTRTRRRWASRPRAARSPTAAAAGVDPLRHDVARLLRQDQRGRDPRGARPRRTRASRSTSPARRAAGIGALRAAAAVGRPRASWPTCAPAGPARPTSATAPTRAAAFLFGDATEAIAEVVGRGVGDRRVPRPLARARRARRPTSGRSASARRCTGR